MAEETDAATFLKAHHAQLRRHALRVGAEAAWQAHLQDADRLQVSAVR